MFRIPIWIETDSIVAPKHTQHIYCRTLKLKIGDKWKKLNQETRIYPVESKNIDEVNVI